MLFFTVPVRDLPEFRKLPLHVARGVDLWLEALAAISTMGGPKHCEALAGSLNARGMSAANLRRKWYEFLKEAENHGGYGWRAVIDYAKMPRVDGLPEAFKAWFLDHKSGFKVKQNCLPAYRAFITKWRDGESIPGIGTWKEWYAKHNKGTAPSACPWSLKWEPPSLSYRNVSRIKAGKTADALARFGIGEARHTLPGVQTDLSQLRPLEMIVFDDFRTDFKILDWESGQVCELWGLAALDLASRTVLRFGLVPRLERADGTKVGISRRDMMHLCAGLLGHYGFPADYPSTWIVENASAAITEELETALSIVSGKMISVRRSCIFHGRAILAGFVDEGRGNPHAKGAIEALWRKTWQDVSNAPGYIGADYSLKPAESGNRFRHVVKLIEAGQSLGMQRAELEEFTKGIIHSFEDARALLEATWKNHNDLESHALRGFDAVKLWRFKGTADWKNSALEALPNLSAEAFAEYVETLQREETPNERLQRLLKIHGLNRHILTTSDMWLLQCDKAVIRYDGAMSFVVQRKLAGRSQKVFFNPTAFHEALKPGEKYLLTFDADNMDFVNVISTDGNKFIGTAPRLLRADPRDLRALEEAYAESERSFHAAIKGVKSRQPIKQLEDRINQLDAATATFSEMRTIEAVAGDEPSTPRRALTQASKAAKRQGGKSDFRDTAREQLRKRAALE